MTDYFEDSKGKWKSQENVHFLIKPSENYTQDKETRRQLKLEQEFLDGLKPSDKDVLIAEVEISTITLLLELGVI